MIKKGMETYIKSNQSELKNVDEDIYNAIAAMTNTDILNDVVDTVGKGEGGIDMCKAFEEMFAEKVEKGIELGKAEERKLSVRNLILTLRELGVEEPLIQDKVMLRYQLSAVEAMEAMQMS